MKSHLQQQTTRPVACTTVHLSELIDSLTQGRRETQGQDDRRIIVPRSSGPIIFGIYQNSPWIEIAAKPIIVYLLVGGNRTMTQTNHNPTISTKRLPPPAGRGVFFLHR